MNRAHNLENKPAGEQLRVLMLGWEFPPFISGGLGTACYGLTKAMDQLGIRITFVLNRTVLPIRRAKECSVPHHPITAAALLEPRFLPAAY